MRSSWIGYSRNRVGGKSTGASSFKAVFTPYERLTYQVPYSPSEVQALLREQVDWPHDARRSRYEGYVEPRSFQFWRRIWYRDSMLPLVNGKVEPDGGGSIIKVLIRPQLFVLGFALITPALLVFLGIFATISAALNNNLSVASTAPFIVAAIDYCSCTLWFRLELRGAVSFLDEIFSGPPIPEDNEPAPWQVS